ncbi:MAG: hypothetical protein M1816_001879 [Peltula sp. TS41687]|nr:MAG: hypothetical protein M1816_001879 [Peltula sp. TS41687]
MHFTLLLITVALLSSSSVFALPLPTTPPSTDQPRKGDVKNPPPGDGHGALTSGLRFAVGAVGIRVGLGWWQERREWVRYRRALDQLRRAPQPNQAEPIPPGGDPFAGAESRIPYEKPDGKTVWVTREQSRKIEDCRILMVCIPSLLTHSCLPRTLPLAHGCTLVPLLNVPSYNMKANRVATWKERLDQCIEYGVNDNMDIFDLDFGPTEAGLKLKADGKFGEWKPEETTSDSNHHNNPSISQMVVDKAKTAGKNLQNAALKISGAIDTVNKKNGPIVGVPGGGSFGTAPQLQMTPSL